MASEHPSPKSAPPRLLDVGCGTGFFLSLAKEQGWAVQGNEISRQHASMAERDFGLPVHQGDFSSMESPDASFDAITMWDLLEHVTDPVATLRKARRLLKSGGGLVILTINSSSLFNALAHATYRIAPGPAKRAIELLYDKRHNYYFTENTLGGLLSEAGFQVSQWVPHRAHLGRWLSEPAPGWMLAVAGLVDFASVPLGAQYRQLVLCQPKK